MKNFKTIAFTAITTTALTLSAGAIGITAYNSLQPAHYQGETFTNVSTSISNTTTSTSISSSSESIEINNSTDNTDTIYTESTQSENLDQRGGTCMGRTSGVPGQVPAEQPTFSVEMVSTRNDVYTVKHNPTGQTTKAVYYDDAQAFCKYMESIAHGKQSLNYSLQDNYNYWLDNIKAK